MVYAGLALSACILTLYPCAQQHGITVEPAEGTPTILQDWEKTHLLEAEVQREQSRLQADAQESTRGRRVASTAAEPHPENTAA